MSKSYNMGGFRVGFAVGNRDLIRALRQIKAVVDFNQYQGILDGAIKALADDHGSIARTVDTLKQRRDVMVQALADMGWVVPMPEATMYLWAKLPDTFQGTAMDFCLKLVAATGVALSPGSGFGQHGEGYVRFALVHPPAKLAESARRIGEFMAAYSQR